MDSWYYYGQEFFVVRSGAPESDVEIGMGPTKAKALEALEGTPIRACGPDGGEGAAIRWAVGAGWIDSADDLEPTEVDEHCECGETSGESCAWEGAYSETVLIEWMPERHRVAHTEARNRGVWPHNGSMRLRVHTDCAARIMESDPDWTRIV